jgi:hypothetical protein
LLTTRVGAFENPRDVLIERRDRGLEPEGQLHRDLLLRPDLSLQRLVEGTDIGGCKVAAIADTPKVRTEGNWRLGVFIDDQASDEQADKLVKVFTGQLGGPMAGLAPLVGELLGVERVPIEVHDEGLRHAVKIGDAIDFEIEDIVPFGVETGEPVRFQGMFHPAGSNLTIAEAQRSRINAFGIEYEGRTGLSTAEFSWAA